MYMIKAVAIKPSITLIERFLAKIERKEGCWGWNGSVQKNGYPNIYGGRLNHRATLKAHRLSYTIYKGTIPYGYTIDHLCMNKGCVNPEHLEAVSNKENTRRYFRSIGSEKFCRNGHPRSTYINWRKRKDNGKWQKECKACISINDAKRDWSKEKKREYRGVCAYCSKDFVSTFKLSRHCSRSCGATNANLRRSALGLYKRRPKNNVQRVSSEALVREEL